MGQRAEIRKLGAQSELEKSKAANTAAEAEKIRAAGETARANAEAERIRGENATRSAENALKIKQEEGRQATEAEERRVAGIRREKAETYANSALGQTLGIVKPFAYLGGGYIAHKGWEHTKLGKFRGPARAVPILAGLGLGGVGYFKGEEVKGAGQSPNLSFSARDAHELAGDMMIGAGISTVGHGMIEAAKDFAKEPMEAKIAKAAADMRIAEVKAQIAEAKQSAELAKLQRSAELHSAAHTRQLTAAQKGKLTPLPNGGKITKAIKSAKAAPLMLNPVAASEVKALPQLVSSSQALNAETLPPKVETTVAGTSESAVRKMAASKGVAGARTKPAAELLDSLKGMKLSSLEKTALGLGKPKMGGKAGLALALGALGIGMTSSFGEARAQGLSRGEAALEAAKATGRGLKEAVGNMTARDWAETGAEAMVPLPVSLTYEGLKAAAPGIREAFARKAEAVKEPYERLQRQLAQRRAGQAVTPSGRPHHVWDWKARQAAAVSRMRNRAGGMPTVRVQ